MPGIEPVEIKSLIGAIREVASRDTAKVAEATKGSLIDGAKLAKPLQEDTFQNSAKEKGNSLFGKVKGLITEDEHVHGANYFLKKFKPEIAFSSALRSVAKDIKMNKYGKAFNKLADPNFVLYEAVAQMPKEKVAYDKFLESICGSVELNCKDSNIKQQILTNMKNAMGKSDNLITTVKKKNSTPIIPKSWAKEAIEAKKAGKSS